MTTHQLDYEQVKRLEQVIGTTFTIHGCHSLPDLEMKPEDLMKVVRDCLHQHGIILEDVRINGSFASSVVGGLEFNNDLDILFNLDSGIHPSNNQIQDRTRHESIKTIVLEAIKRNFLIGNDSQNTQHQNNKNFLLVTTDEMVDAYVQKYVCVQNGSNDLWSLVSLRNDSGKNIELKFVDSMKRKYEFSIDSFQLILDDFFEFRETSKESFSPKLYPTIRVESVYGDYETAFQHLEQRLIQTRKPEEIRGGGLLKYCYLTVCGFKDANSEEMNQLKRYMCSRFFIDFADPVRQNVQLDNYILTHFKGRENLRIKFLEQVYHLVQQNAVCLPNRERNRTLNMISDMAYLPKQNNNPINNNFVNNYHHNNNNNNNIFQHTFSASNIMYNCFNSGASNYEPFYLPVYPPIYPLTQVMSS